MNYSEESLKKHYEWRGKIGIECKIPLETRDDLSLAYTPGVAEPCLEINRDPEKSFELTARSNLVAVVTDGTAVLGLGDIGAEAAMPVMEGKCALFKHFADVDAFPVCIKSQNVDEIVNTVRLISGSFGGINLEDISAPRCFEIEEKLKEFCEIPVFHDDQHGTAIVVLAALINALKLTNRTISETKAVINGAGAAGLAIARLLMSAGLKNPIICDRTGAIYKGRNGLNSQKADIAEVTNLHRKSGALEDVLVGADLFIGVSSPDCVTEEMVRSMAEKPIIFALANPRPEIMPDIAKTAGAAIVGTGRSDFPNQINNLLAFPGIFRGALDVRAKEITEEMKSAAAYAIASYIPEKELSPDRIIPDPLDKGVAKAVAKAVTAAYKQ